MIYSLLTQRIEYGWNKETVLAVSIPFASSWIQRVQETFLRGPVELPEGATIRSSIQIMQQSHFLGYLAQTVTFLSLSILLDPLFLVPADLAAIEFLFTGGILIRCNMIAINEQLPIIV